MTFNFLPLCAIHSAKAVSCTPCEGSAACVHVCMYACVRACCLLCVNVNSRISHSFSIISIIFSNLPTISTSRWWRSRWKLLSTAAFNFFFPPLSLRPPTIFKRHLIDVEEPNYVYASFLPCMHVCVCCTENIYEFGH